MTMTGKVKDKSVKKKPGMPGDRAAVSDVAGQSSVALFGLSVASAMGAYVPQVSSL